MTARQDARNALRNVGNTQDTHSAIVEHIAATVALVEAVSDLTDLLREHFGGRS